MSLVPRIVIAGAGGLGVPVAWALASTAKVPLHLELLDFDVVDLSNLHRQVLFQVADIGQPKALRLRERLLPLTVPTVTLSANCAKLEQDTVAAHLSHASLVIDCLDSIEHKFLINDYCIAKGIPFCYGGTIATRGLAFLSAPQRSTTRACLRCIFNDAEADNEAVTCRTGGILGPVAGATGMLMAEMVLALLEGTIAQQELMQLTLEKPIPRRAQVYATACSNLCSQRQQKLLDLRTEVCPSTFLYTKIALQSVGPNTTLEAHYGKKESATNVLGTLQEEGYRARSLGYRQTTNSWVLLIENELESANEP